MSKPRLMVATRNRHKSGEIRAMVGERFEVVDANDIDGLPEIEETGSSFLENATLKAVGIKGATLRKVAHGNWLRVLKETWKK